MQKNMNWMNKLERRFGGWAIEKLSLYIIIGQVLAWGLFLANENVYSQMVYIPQRVLEGEVWRLFSFILIPPLRHPLLMLIAWYIFYMFGSSLERVWGAFYYNLYILIGAMAVVLSGFLFPGMPIGNGFLGLSVFLAFAYLFPDFEILLMFILPVKMKWIGLIGAAAVAIQIILGTWPIKVFALASVANFMIFFGRDIFRRTRAKQRVIHRKAERQREAAIPFHTCSKCGATDLSHPEREFRYRGEDAICSECSNGSENSEGSA